MIFPKKTVSLGLLYAFIYSVSVQAQEVATLPDMNAITKDGINILSWNNPYESGIKSIAVQRSADSNYNFTTIGLVPKFTQGLANYVDPHPMPGKNWYRLVILFNSGVDFKSNLRMLFVDSMAIANQKQLPSSEQIQKIINQNSEESPKEVVNSVMNEVQGVSYPKSKYVYTNPFSGNVNIELSDAMTNLYKIDFYDTHKKKVLSVPRIGDKVVILDKRNFNATGIYQFTLYKNNKEYEKGYITIY